MWLTNLPWSIHSTSRVTCDFYTLKKKVYNNTSVLSLSFCGSTPWHTDMSNIRQAHRPRPKSFGHSFKEILTLLQFVQLLLTPGPVTYFSLFFHSSNLHFSITVINVDNIVSTFLSCLGCLIMIISIVLSSRSNGLCYSLVLLVFLQLSHLYLVPAHSSWRNLIDGWTISLTITISSQDGET